MNSELTLLIFFWMSFFVLHSVLASNAVKAWVLQRFPRIHSRYRLLYNIIAMLTVVPAAIIALFSDSATVWQWQGYLYWVSAALTLLGLVGFVGTTRYYDMGVFLGFVPDQEAHAGDPKDSFTVSPFHRYVRHPWYFFGIILIWAQDMTVYWLVTCILLTLYFWVGSRLEEKKLVEYYGESYKKYQSLVPGLFPLPGQNINAEQAEALSPPRF